MQELRTILRTWSRTEELDRTKKRTGHLKRFARPKKAENSNEITNHNVYLVLQTIIFKAAQRRMTSVINIFKDQKQQIP